MLRDRIPVSLSRLSAGMPSIKTSKIVMFPEECENNVHAYSSRSPRPQKKSRQRERTNIAAFMKFREPPGSRGDEQIIKQIPGIPFRGRDVKKAKFERGRGGVKEIANGMLH